MLPLASVKLTIIRLFPALRGRVKLWSGEAGRRANGVWGGGLETRGESPAGGGLIPQQLDWAELCQLERVSTQSHISSPYNSIEAAFWVCPSLAAIQGVYVHGCRTVATLSLVIPGGVGVCEAGSGLVDC